MTCVIYANDVAALYFPSQSEAVDIEVSPSFRDRKQCMLGLLQTKDRGNEVGITSTQVLLLVRMSAEHMNPVTFGSTNRFLGFTCLKVCYYFNSKRPYQKL